jgi:flavodoxin
MKSIVIYCSRYGNTEKVAMAIAAGLRTKGQADVYEVGEAPSSIPEDVDLVAIGGPTEGHMMTRPVANYLEAVAQGGSTRFHAVAFDTRVRWPRWLSGSAGEDIARTLQASGAAVVVPSKSFFVFHKASELEPGELERAEAWGQLVADKIQPRTPAGAFAEQCQWI